jgi:hypothetical protein
LRWAKKISAVWPDRELDELVPTGDYNLVLEVYGEELNAELRSRPVSIHVGR